MALVPDDNNAAKRGVIKHYKATACQTSTSYLDDDIAKRVEATVYQRSALYLDDDDSKREVNKPSKASAYQRLTL